MVRNPQREEGWREVHPPALLADFADIPGEHPKSTALLEETPPAKRNAGARRLPVQKGLTFVA